MKCLGLVNIVPRRENAIGTPVAARVEGGPPKLIIFIQGGSSKGTRPKWDPSRFGQEGGWGLAARYPPTTGALSTSCGSRRLASGRSTSNEIRKAGVACSGGD